MLYIKKTTVGLLMSSMACIAMDYPGMDYPEDVLVSSLGSSPVASLSKSTGGIANPISIDTSKLAPQKKSYNVYVSIVIQNFEDEARKKLVHAHNTGLLYNFKECEIPQPHVTLYDTNLLLTQSQSNDLTTNLNNVLNEFKKTEITLKDVEIGGMHSGEKNKPYFIAYNLNEPGSQLKTITQKIRETVKEEPKTYEDYSSTMSLNGFTGLFTKHLPGYNEQFLHMSLLRAYGTNKNHPIYGKAWDLKHGVEKAYGLLKAQLSQCLTPKKDDTDLQKWTHRLILETVHKYDKITDEIIQKTTPLFDEATETDIQATFNGNPPATPIKGSIAKLKGEFIAIFVKPFLIRHIKIKSKIVLLCQDLINNQEKLKPDLAINQKDTWSHSVTGDQGVEENKKADTLCTELQTEVNPKDLKLSIKKFEVKMRIID